MAKQSRRKGKYFAPQNENKHHTCDHPGCDRAGEYRAPKDRNLKEYYWFCLEHVQEYNSKWNYYGDENFSEPEEELHRKFRFSSRIKYNFGFDFDGSYDFFDKYPPSNTLKSFYTADEKKALQLMDLDVKTLNVENLKKAYKKAVKKYHPDINNSDSTAEENFKIISICYKSLLVKLT